MNEGDTLVRNTHRRGKRRRQKLKLALQVLLSAIFLGVSLVLSAGVVRVVERPVAPWAHEAGSDQSESPQSAVPLER